MRWANRSFPELEATAGRSFDPRWLRNPEALAQGPTRYARAHYFHECGLQEAKRLGVTCHWKLVPIPGVGHDGCAMGKAAAAIWFEGRVPPAEELISESQNVA